MDENNKLRSALEQNIEHMRPGTGQKVAQITESYKNGAQRFHPALSFQKLRVYILREPA
jgi:hypothetical protein